MSQTKQVVHTMESTETGDVKFPKTFIDVVYNCSKKGASLKHALTLIHYMEWVVWLGVLEVRNGLPEQKLE